MRGMLYRAFMAARFNRATYRDVLRDHEAILNALGIVILAGIAYAVGQSSAMGESAEQGLDAGAIGDRLLGVWFASITFMVGWLVWAGIAYGVGRVFQRDEATFREILRVLGVCFGPGLLLFLTAITPVEGVVFNAVMIWMLVAGIVRPQGDSAVGLARRDNGRFARMGGGNAAAAGGVADGVLRYGWGCAGGVAGRQALSDH